MKSRIGAQLAAEEIAMHEVRTRWESGITATKPKQPLSPAGSRQSRQISRLSRK